MEELTKIAPPGRTVFSNMSSDGVHRNQDGGFVHDRLVTGLFEMTMLAFAVPSDFFECGTLRSVASFYLLHLMLLFPRVGTWSAGMRDSSISALRPILEAGS